MDQAPDVANTAWGHKYFSVLFPDKVDTYHVEEYQRFHLIKLLQEPPEGSGRYLAAARFVALAHNMGMSLLHVVHTLNRRNGRPHRVWRIGTRLSETNSIWPLMRRGSCVAIGWSGIGDLSALKHDQKSKDWLRQQMLENHHAEPGVASRKAGEVLNFATVMAEGDLVLAADGRRVLGVGRVTGGYRYDREFHREAPHLRPVEWLLLDDWEQPVSEGLRTTVFPTRKNAENLLAVERRLLDASETPSMSDNQTSVTARPSVRLGGISGRVQAVLERKSQVILTALPALARATGPTVPVGTWPR